MALVTRPRLDLEGALLRRGVGALAASRCRCHACRRTPLIGERVALYEDGRTLCALCRGRRRDAPASTPVVRPGARGSAVTLRPAAWARVRARAIDCAAVDPVTVSTTIGRPREEVFAYLLDVANHPEFTDHFLSDWHLTRVESIGTGAGARFRVDAPLNRFSWADFTITDVEAPHRIVQVGRGGKFNRIRQRGEWVLSPGAGGTTRVEFTQETIPALPSDRLLELLAGRRWFRRRLGKAMRRLQSILEEDRDRGRRATIAGR